MKSFTCVVGLIVLGLTTASASAALGFNFNIDNTLPGISQNEITIDTDSDFLSAVIFIQLTAGSVHDPTTFLGFAVDGELVAPGNGDTFVTANGNTSTIIAGGAGDLDAGAPAAATITPSLVGIAWGSPGADTDDIGTGLPIGRFSVTDDAQGTWQLLLTNEGGDRVIVRGELIDGWIPEPASLGMLTLGGLALLRRGR